MPLAPCFSSEPGTGLLNRSSSRGETLVLKRERTKPDRVLVTPLDTPIDTARERAPVSLALNLDPMPAASADQEAVGRAAAALCRIDDVAIPVPMFLDAIATGSSETTPPDTRPTARSNAAAFVAPNDEA